MSGDKPKKTSAKRKAETQLEKEDSPPDKKQDTGESKLTVLYVKNIPPPDPEACVNQNISSGLVVGFSIQEIANILFNEFFGNAIHSQEQQQEIEHRIGQWINGGIEVSLIKPHLYVVNDGPPLAMELNLKKSSDARLANSSKQQSVFISKHFSEQTIFPGVAIGVASNKTEFETKIREYIKENVDMDLRPADVAERVPDTGDIIQVNLKEPAFYRLATGSPYDEYVN